MKMLCAAAAAAWIAGAPSAALAQTRAQAPPSSRGFIALNGVYQATSSSFRDRVEFQEFVETGSVETAFDAKSALGLDGSAGIRVWRNLGIGAGVTTYAPGSRDDAGGQVTARIPHPLEFNRHREVSGEASLRRGETAIHANLLYFIPVGEKIQAVIGAGPTFFQAEQGFVDRVLYDHQYPYDTASFRGVDIDNETASGVGFNAGVDISWRFSRWFGAGGMVRFTQGTLSFTPADRTVKVDVGGLQAGLGVRVLF